MSVNFVDIDRRSVGVLEDKTAFRDIVPPASQDDFHSMLHQLMQDGFLRQKISLHSDSFDDILRMGDTAMRLFGLAQPPNISRALYSAISLAGTESSREVFQELLRMLGQYSISCSKLCSHYDEPSSVPVEESQRKFAAAYEAVICFLVVVILKLDFKKINVLTSPLWKEILEAHDKCQQDLKEACEALDQSRTRFRSNISSSAMSMRSFHTAIPAPSSQGITASSYSMLPKKPHKIYYRHEEMQSLKQGLEEYRSICIHGIGGVGKTSLALLYAHQSLSEYQFIFFLRSDSELSLNQDFTQVAQKLKLPGVNDEQHSANRELVLEWLQSTPYRWLLIFDEADNGDLTADFWPASGNGSIIVTTRAESVGFEFCEEQIRLDVFSSEVGAKVVMQLSSWGGGQPADLQSAELLSNELEGLPLGINQMVAEMRRQKQPLVKFVKLYREDKHRYHSRRAGRGSGGYEKRLATNWLISFKGLEELPDCRVLFGILTLLKHTSIPEELFNHWSSPASRSTCPLLSFCNRENDFVEVEAALLERALIDKNPSTGALSVHKVVQVEFESFLGKEGRQSSFDLASKLLHNMFPKTYTGSRLDDTSRSQYARYIQHLLALNDHYINPPQSLPPLDATPEFTTLTSYCAWYLFEIADFPNLRRLLEGGIKACEEVNEADRDKTTYAFLHHISGTAETAQGNFRAAEKSLRLALTIRENLKRPNIDDITMTLNNLGIVYNSLQKYDEAAQYLSRARQLLVESRGQGTEDRDQVQSIKMAEHNLQRISIQGKTKTVKREDLADMISFFEKRGNWFMTGHCYLILGMFLQESGDIPGSKHAFGEARDWLNQPGRAEKSPQTAMMIYKLGYVTYISKDFINAECLFKESLKISKLHAAIPGEQARTLAMLAKSQWMIPGKRSESEKNMSEANNLLQKLKERTKDFEDVQVEDEVAMNRIVTGFYQ